MFLDYIAIGERLRKAREIAGLSRKDMASPIEVSASYIANIENGKKPSLEYLFLAAEKCTVSLDWLIKGTEHSAPCSDDILDEIISICKSTPIDARAVLLGVLKTIIQNSSPPKNLKTSSSLTNGENGDLKSNIA